MSSSSPVPSKSHSQSQPLHNFELPRLKWKTEGTSGAHHRRRTIKSPPPRPTPSPSPIRHSPRPEPVSERNSPKPPVVLGEPFSFKPLVGREKSDSEGEEASRRSSERPIIEYHRNYQRNVVKIGGLDASKVEKKANEGGEGDVVKKPMNKLLIKIPIKNYNNRQEEENGKKNVVRIESGNDKELVKVEGKNKYVVGKGKEGVKIEGKNGDVVSKGKEGVKVESKNKDVVSKCKEVVKVEGKKSEGKGKEVVRIEGKKKDVESNGKEVVRIEGKCKEVVRIEGKMEVVESKGKEPVKIEAKKREVQGKDKEVVRMEKIVESKDGEQAEKEEKVPNNDGVDEEMKSWNLRPRKPINKSLNANKGGNALKASGLNGSTSTKTEKGKTQSPTSNVKDNSGEKEKKASGSGGGGEKKEKPKLTINPSLNRCEVEEDMYAFTRAKPARRPKKRPKNVQNLLDTLYPGQNLVGISADTYYVSANSMKKQG